jgi:hypothetical protein
MSTAIAFDGVSAPDLAKARRQTDFTVIRETQSAENIRLIMGRLQSVRRYWFEAVFLELSADASKSINRVFRRLKSAA